MSDVINPEWKAKVIQKIEEIPTCQMLEEYMAQILESIQDQIAAAVQNNALADMVKSYLPIEAPSSIDDVISWATDLTDMLNTFYENYLVAPYNKTVAFISEITTFQADVVAAITAKKSELSCTFTIPS